MWKMFFGISVLFFLLFSSIGFSQINHTLVDNWEVLIKADDNEKDYRFSSFLDFLEQDLLQEDNTFSERNFPEEWTVVDLLSDNLSACAALVDFEMRPDRLIYCFVDNEKNVAIVDYKEVESETEEVDLIIESESFDDLNSVKIFDDKKKLLDVPDLKSVFILKSIRQSRGVKTVFNLAESLRLRMNLLMQNPDFFEHNFSDLQGVSTLISSDEQLKLVTWNVEEMNGDHHLFGLVAVRVEDRIRVFNLQDKSDNIASPEYAGLSPDKWFGAVYYEVITEKYRGDTFYTLLGYHGNDAFSRLRVVDVITLGSSGRPRFGALIFDDHGRTKRRLIYEYSNKANMMLRFDDRSDRIVMDHLAPMEPMYEGNYSYYGPDFSYDVLEWEKGKWVLEKNVELRNR